MSRPRIVRIKSILLREWQVEWAERIQEILHFHHGYVDTSVTGAGKTLVTLYTAKQLNIPILVVCPSSAIGVWKKESEKYQIPLVDIISYQSLRSQKGRNPNHPYLFRVDKYNQETNINKVSFVPTPHYLDLIEKGILIVLDEIQNVKNRSAQHKASLAMVQPIFKGGLSRYALLSATPFDKIEHSINMMCLMGIITTKNMYYTHKTTGMVMLKGMDDLIKFCKRINPEITDLIAGQEMWNKRDIEPSAFALFEQVIKPVLIGSMPPPTDNDGYLDIKNGFYKIKASESEIIQQRLKDIQDLVDKNPVFNVNVRGNITKGLIAIEESKLEDIARIICITLESNPSYKIIAGLNYLNNIRKLSEFLYGHDPLILTGKVKANKRVEIIDKFNNSTDYNVLIMNTTVGGVAISLHDTTTEHPRFMILSPSYKLLDLVQATGRIHRDGQGIGIVRIFYSKECGNLETKLMTKIAEKSGVLKRVIDNKEHGAMLLPHEYEIENEE